MLEPKWGSCSWTDKTPSAPNLPSQSPAPFSSAVEEQNRPLTDTVQQFLISAGKALQMKLGTATSQRRVRCSFISVTHLDDAITLRGVAAGRKVNIAVSHRGKTSPQVRGGAGALGLQISRGDYRGSATCLMPKSLLS